MSFYTKEAYARKQEYAYKVSVTSTAKILAALGLGEDDDAIDCVARASHARHEIHSNGGRHYSSGYYWTDLDEIGTQFSVDITLADEIDALKLIPEEFPRIHIPEIDDDDSTEVIFGYCGIEMPYIDDESDLRDAALSQLSEEWEREIDEWSESVRAWFRHLNKKFDTNFPS